MARGRMISKSLSTSKKWNSLTDWFARSLYLLLVVHADDYGIVDGDPQEVKWKILPAASESPEEFDHALGAMECARLIHRYVVGDHELTEIVDFDQHQQGLHKRTERRFPSFADTPADNETASWKFREIPGNSGKFLETPLGSGEFPLNIREYNLKEEDLLCQATVSKTESDNVNQVPGKSAKEADEIDGENEIPIKPQPKRNKPTRTDNHHEERTEIINLLNSLLGSKYATDSRAAQHINTRLNEGATLAECLSVVKHKVSQWKGDAKYCAYLRPATLFNSEKFEGYREEARLAVEKAANRGGYTEEQWTEIQERKRQRMAEINGSSSQD